MCSEPTINPRTKRDEIMFHIFRGGLMGLPYVSLWPFIGTHSQQIKELKETFGYIKHHSDHNWSLTDAGLKSLEARYRNMPTSANFEIGEVRK